MMLTKFYPDMPVVAAPWPHVRLSDGIVSWVGRIEKRVWLRLVTLETVEIPGAIPLGDGSILFPMFLGRGSRNRLRTLCRRGHVLPSKRNSQGRRVCWQCQHALRRARASRSSSPVQGSRPVSGPGAAEF
jgi:hypothetical protein